MRIYVTKDDIAHGIPCNSGKCPIARSLQRRFPNSFISVSNDGVYVDRVVFLLPARAKRFIRRFDFRPNRQKPFSFVLEL